MKMKNFFCGMIDRRKTFRLISSLDHCQRSSPSRMSNTPRAAFEPVQNLSSGFVEGSCAAVAISTTPRRHCVTCYSCSYYSCQMKYGFLVATETFYVSSTTTTTLRVGSIRYFLILFIKLELHCGRFVPLRNSKILFDKTSYLILSFPSLTRLTSKEPNLSSLFKVLQQFIFI